MVEGKTPPLDKSSSLIDGERADLTSDTYAKSLAKVRKKNAPNF